MCEVLSHLGIVPGMPTIPPAMEAVKSWVELEDQEEVVKALAADAEAVLVEKMNDKFSEEPDSDEEEEINDTGEIESAGGRKLVAPPPYTELSGFFGPLEQLAQSAGNTEAGHFLRKAKMSFLAAHAVKPVRQADMRMFLESIIDASVKHSSSRSACSFFLCCSMLRAWMFACLFCTLCGVVVHCFNATACSVRFVALLCVAVLLYRNAMILLVVA